MTDREYMEYWSDLIHAATDDQLLGMWENGVDMTNNEYTVWLEEVKDRGIR